MNGKIGVRDSELVELRSCLLSLRLYERDVLLVVRQSTTYLNIRINLVVHKSTLPYCVCCSIVVLLSHASVYLICILESSLLNCIGSTLYWSLVNVDVGKSVEFLVCSILAYLCDVLLHCSNSLRDMLVSCDSLVKLTCVQKSLSIVDVVVGCVLDSIGCVEQLITIVNSVLILLNLIWSIHTYTIEWRVMRIFLNTSSGKLECLVIILKYVCCRSIVEKDIIVERIYVLNLAVVLESCLQLVVWRVHITSSCINRIVRLYWAKLLKHGNCTVGIYLLVNTSVLNISCRILRSLLCWHFIVRSCHTTIVLCRSNVATKDITGWYVLAYLHCHISISLGLLIILSNKESTSESGKSLSVLFICLNKVLDLRLSCNCITFGVYDYFCNGINLRFNVLCHCWSSDAEHQSSCYEIFNCFHNSGCLNVQLYKAAGQKLLFN